MRKHLLWSLLLTLSASANEWQTYLERNVLRGHPEALFPDAQFLQMPWRESSDMAFDGVPLQPSQLHQGPINCAKKTLWPTHPQQSTKEYLHAVYANYDQARLPGGSSACEIHDRAGRFCLRATWANLIVMSDTFEDTCGHRYRGYWLVSFLKKDDNMGTLLSKGRTVYPKPNAQWESDMEDGGTYAVEAKDFLLFTDLLAKDQTNINLMRTQALAHRYKLVGQQFVAK